MLPIRYQKNKFTVRKSTLLQTAYFLIKCRVSKSVKVLKQFTKRESGIEEIRKKTAFAHGSKGLLGIEEETAFSKCNYWGG